MGAVATTALQSHRGGREKTWVIGEDFSLRRVKMTMKMKVTIIGQQSWRWLQTAPYCSHIEFEDSEEEAGDTVVTGGLRLGQTGGDQMRGVRQGGQTRGQVRPGQSKMPTDGLTSSISRFDNKEKIPLFLYSPALPSVSWEKLTTSLKTTNRYCRKRLSIFPLFDDYCSGCAGTRNVDKSRDFRHRQCVCLHLEVFPNSMFKVTWNW